ncbi:aminoglycoside N(3)-acetyltransferase [Sporolactobacillus sp. THM19-2]|uniref:aminoglycoside N(3)-acetyltransferase n=1 Tax=Sporolactobacillus sp. THM19-2 TaxID=2511171 RepID=UPI0010214122|nr:AAC(3) family N-acetyltransferase [Sporolactobacillus sp. THM19-2]RYL88100.1 AAC(3) family N-acetyltransferase [Sporolactobacillus sp. THM19-2]
MSEKDVIRQTKRPVTRSSLVSDLRKIGLKKGMTVLVHTSMSRIGWVCGGPVTVIEALQDVLTSEGTLVMPAHSGDVSDPADWGNPPVPQSWISTIYHEMPPFDPLRTPTLGMGRVAETFRMFPGVRRSSHPIYSFTAWGAGRDQIVSGHALNDGLGMDSPLGRIFNRQGFVLLIGVGYGNNTSMHLGEYLSGTLKEVRRKSPVLQHHERRWVTYRDWDYHEERFAKIGKQFESSQTGPKQLSAGKIGQADARLMSQPAIVTFTAHTLKKQ